jgi:hypothetical protein
MSTSDPLAEARRFADTAYSAQLDVITRKFNKELQSKRAELAARGLVMSGAMVREMARINGERITALLQARVDGWLEGLELHNVQIDEPLTAVIVEEIMSLRQTQIGHAVSAYSVDPVVRNLVSVSHYQPLLEGEISIAANSVRTQVDRKRLAKRTNTEKNTVYHIQGDNPRVNINSEDHSLNAKITSSESTSQQDSSRGSEGLGTDP